MRKSGVIRIKSGVKSLESGGKRVKAVGVESGAEIRVARERSLPREGKVVDANRHYM